MLNFRVLIVLVFLIILNEFTVFAQPQPKINFTLSMEKSNPSKFLVQLCFDGPIQKIQDFKMPAIAPGYYRVLDFAANVESFNAEDNEGNSLPWEKIAKNTWRIGTDQTTMILISYKVKSDFDSVANSFIDEKRAYISTPSVFIYPVGYINVPVTVTLIPPADFTKISTGLDVVEGKTNAFYARNFDALYDCPIYTGNQEVVSFEVQGIPHYIAMESPGNFNRQQFKSGMKKMIETATALMGEIPYHHYTFIFMGEGKGGLEHQNSSAEFITVSGELNPWSETDFQKFLTHEYFHLYNVKAIRPIALGPFSYDGENSTDMLWFSEGGTVYYEYLILNRAGFLSSDKCLKEFSSIIADIENNPARLTQSVAEASEKAWTQSFFGNEKEISYYDKGCALSLLLDLKIRHATKNIRSLDDVIRKLYYDFFKKKQRGFTNGEFRQVCEQIAGISLEDLFAYIYNTEEIDYGTYLSYAGLKIELLKEKDMKKKIIISPVSNPSPMQKEIFQSWLNE